MTEYITKWAPEEFKAYVLMYCSTADFVMSNKEKKLIRSKIDTKSYRRLHKEFYSDSESVRVAKIRSTAGRYRDSEHPPKNLITDVMALFISDGTYSKLESDLLAKLKSLLG